MALRLRDNLHWCECDGRVVLLDITADRYFCLPARANGSFLALAGEPSEPPADDGLAVLIERGILVRTASPEHFQTPAELERPARDYLGQSVRRSGVVPLLRALWWECRSALQLRRHRFSEVVARAARRTGKLELSSMEIETRIRSIAAAADAIAFVTRSHNRCLLRALGVHAACASAGVRAKFVIGVISHPFAAHSWVQLDDAVLVGGYEQARLYTPILVVE